MIRTTNNKQQTTKKGFTIIELLVVVSVIGILAGLILARLGTAEKSGRDTKRKSDLNQYRIALESYAVKTNGVYPTLASLGHATDICGVNLKPAYMSSCMEDPRYDNGNPYLWYYRYQSNGSGAWGAVTATQYILWVGLENGGYWYFCSNGQAAAKTTAPTTSDCGF